MTSIFIWRNYLAIHPTAEKRHVLCTLGGIGVILLGLPGGWKACKATSRLAGIARLADTTRLADAARLAGSKGISYSIFYGKYIYRFCFYRARVLLVYLYTLPYLFQQPQAPADLFQQAFPSPSFLNLLHLHHQLLGLQKVSHQRVQSINIAALTNQRCTRSCRIRYRSTRPTPPTPLYWRELGGLVDWLMADVLDG
ncbi:hypothetical protein GGI42DRAFT_58378 [Trichoderma sp. SZMC 28013]